MERFENAIFKQREEINDRMVEMFGLLKEHTTSRAPEKVLIRKEAKSPVTKNVLVKEAEIKNGAENRTKNKLIKGAEKEEAVEAPNSQPVEYYQKHWINEKLIEGLVDNNRFNDSMSGVRVGKIKGNTYNLSPRGPVYEAILRKKITKKEDIGGNFEIPCNVRGLKLMNALVDQGSDVNVIPLSTYMKLTNKRPVDIDIRFSLASHSYIYPLGIADDILVNVASYAYLVDFVILDIKEDEKRHFILGTLFETYVKSKDLDLWHVITDGDFQPIVQNPETKLDEVIPFEKQIDDLKKKLAKNNEAKMVIYNALPRKEYVGNFELLLPVLLYYCWFKIDTAVEV
ncbi:MAK10-like protein [Tanacetum coccineum]